MFKEDLSVFFNDNDFSDTVFYKSDSSSIKISAIIDENVEIIGINGEVSEVVTTMTTKSDSLIGIGGNFKTDTDDYIVDYIISDDGAIKVLSVVKQ